MWIQSSFFTQAPDSLWVKVVDCWSGLGKKRGLKYFITDKNFKSWPSSTLRKEGRITFIICLKLFKNDNKKHMFPTMIKSHEIIWRKEEELKGSNANTYRLFKSKIPYMQRLRSKEDTQRWHRIVIQFFWEVVAICKIITIRFWNI